jgi:hypothetical protein
MSSNAAARPQPPWWATAVLLAILAFCLAFWFAAASAALALGAWLLRLPADTRWHVAAFVLLTSTIAALLLLRRAFGPSNTPRPGAADPSSASPMRPEASAPGRGAAPSSTCLFSLSIPSGVSVDEFARTLGLRHSDACSCRFTPGQAPERCSWEVLPEIRRANPDARVIAAGRDAHIFGVVGRWS